jgi:DNA-binding NtrC family response regulator
MARILIADHLSERRNILCTFLRTDEHVLIPVAREAEAIKSLRETPPDLIILEGTVAGTKLLTEAKEVDLGPAVIMLMGGPPSVEQLVELMNQGVSDVLVSPLDINDVQTKVERALNRRPATDALQIRFHDLVGSSAKMQQVFRKTVKVAASDNPVLLVGEPGTGKRLVAEQIHRLSARKDREFRSAHCAGLTEAELESELFGHEPGVFPWAVGSRPGLLEVGEGGTVYLDGIDELPAPLQGKLLRFLEGQTLIRLGGSRPFTADVRLLTGCTSPLYHKIEEGSFRSDLYYRLSACQIELPPLRLRPNDIPELIDLFLGRYDVQIAGEAVEVLMNYAWPGNVDELKNAVEQAITLCDGNRVELKDLPGRVLKAVAMSTRKYKYMTRPKEKAE